jgi:hypothetical protein
MALTVVALRRRRPNNNRAGLCGLGSDKLF